MKTSPLPFHKWKYEQMKKDKLSHGCDYIREKVWYYSAYG